MKCNPKIHHRRSIRLQGYDYSRAGAYFVTICTRYRECLFGDIADGEMRLNAIGHIVANEWVKTAEIRNEIELDEWVVMPNHFHGILVIYDRRGTARRARNDDHGVMGTARRAPTTTTMERFGKPVAGSMPTVIRSFKSAATKRINEMRKTPGAKLWQRNYWEHVVRNESELNRIREYIQNNPNQWESDKLHPRQLMRDGRGTARRAPTGIREPSAIYGYVASSSHDEGWMV